jgi:hypothetical protein
LAALHERRVRGSAGWARFDGWFHGYFWEVVVEEFVGGDDPCDVEGFILFSLLRR